MEFLDVLYGALAGYQAVVILLLIFLDLGLGVAAALRTRTFDGDRMADFYKTQVLPDIIGYTVIHVAVKVAIMYPVIATVLGNYAALASEVLLGLALAALVAKLGKSALGSVKKLAWGDD